MYINILQDLDKEITYTLSKINNGKPMLSDMHKHDRLTKLKVNIAGIIKKHIEEIEKGFLDVSSDMISKNYEQIMLHLDKIDFSIANKELINQIIRYPWSGATFSERLWKNTQLLTFNLNEILTKGLVQGKTISEMTDMLVDRMNSEYKIALRLIRTETMAYLNNSSVEAYKKAGVSKVQWWTALDERVSSECKSLHSKIFDINNIPMIPKHANCRCTIIPIVEVDDD